MRKPAEKREPSRRPYVFQAIYPIALLSLLERMYQLWLSVEEMDRLQVTGLFYQFVHEQFRQLQLASDEVSAPDLAEQMNQYIQEHYREAISMDTLANLFHYSTHYLAKVFKRKFECSPIDYLIQTRFNQAKIPLIESNASIRDIAESVGYTDMYYFSRLFKKLTAV